MSAYGWLLIRAVQYGPKKISRFFEFDFNHDFDTNRHALVINAFCLNLIHISKGSQLDLSQKVVTCL